MSGRLGKNKRRPAGLSLGRLIVAAAALMSPLGIASAQTVLERMERDETSSVPAGNEPMEAAFAKARASLDNFLALLDKPLPNTDTYSVKLRIVDPRTGTVEFFWVVDLRRDAQGFSGRINNTPRSVTNVRLGQVVRFTRAEIYDWMYADSNFTNADRSIVGNFTLCAVLTREPPKEADAVKRKTGLVCD